MNKNNAKDYLPFVQAMAEGKTIQGCIDTKKYSWSDYGEDECLTFDAPVYYYRIKPEPRVVWINDTGTIILTQQEYDSEERAKSGFNKFIQVLDEN